MFQDDRLLLPSFNFFHSDAKSSQASRTVSYPFLAEPANLLTKSLRARADDSASSHRLKFRCAAAEHAAADVLDDVHAQFLPVLLLLLLLPPAAPRNLSRIKSGCDDICESCFTLDATNRSK
eukprot:g7328.t1